MGGSGERGTLPLPRVASTDETPDAAPCGTDPDPSVTVEVIALSPRTLAAATSRFAWEACGKASLREHSHRRGHAHGDNRLPEDSAQGEVMAGTGRHRRRHRHGERKWKCDLCGKRYGADYDWEAHARVCGVGNKALHRLALPPQSQTGDRGGR